MHIHTHFYPIFNWQSCEVDFHPQFTTCCSLYNADGGGEIEYEGTEEEWNCKSDVAVSKHWSFCHFKQWVILGDPSPCWLQVHQEILWIILLTKSHLQSWFILLRFYLGITWVLHFLQMLNSSIVERSVPSNSWIVFCSEKEVSIIFIYLNGI